MMTLDATRIQLFFGFHTLSPTRYHFTQRRVAGQVGNDRLIDPVQTQKAAATRDEGRISAMLKSNN
jgi:hypothetical protein